MTSKNTEEHREILTNKELEDLLKSSTGYDNGDDNSGGGRGAED